jgi:2-keto-myo-inositol isomerase
MPLRGLALHTGSLDSTPLAEALRVARQTGWDAIELRRVDFQRAIDAGGAAEGVLELVRSSGLPIACVGAQFGWMFAQGSERERLLGILADACRWAAALGCDMVMSPADLGRGDPRAAAASVREAGDLAAAHGVRLAIEAASVAQQVNSVDRARELLAAAGHPHCGLLLDAYHLQRSGDGMVAIEDVAPEEIFYVQYSDLPAGPIEPGMMLNRLPPGQGVVPFGEFFERLEAKGYRGYASYEALNPAAWTRDPSEVAGEALAATRAFLPR